MHQVRILPTFEAWRDEARSLLARSIAPDGVLWSDSLDEGALFAAPPSVPAPAVAFTVDRAFLDLGRCVAAHRSPTRWPLLYRMLWRITHGERHLLALATDGDVRRAQSLAKAVRRDIHKMHAFVRFRLVGANALSGREQFVAWFEPEHRILRMASSFFVKRFAGMEWSILTPAECAHWDGQGLQFTPGVTRDRAPDDDELEKLWCTYYRSIFNPARVKVKMMESEMPKKYWKNLPEATLISELLRGSGERVTGMLAEEARPAAPAPRNAYLERLRARREEEQ